MRRQSQVLTCVVDLPVLGEAASLGEAVVRIDLPCNVLPSVAAAAALQTRPYSGSLPGYEMPARRTGVSSEVSYLEMKKMCCIIRCTTIPFYQVWQDKEVKVQVADTPQQLPVSGSFPGIYVPARGWENQFSLPRFLAEDRVPVGTRSVAKNRGKDS